MLKYLFPDYVKCQVCSDEIYDNILYGMCEKCYDKLELTSNYKCCSLCGRPILTSSGYKHCIECQKYIRVFTSGYSCAIYDGLAEKIILDFKYNDKSYLFKLVSDFMIEKIIENNVEFDYIVYTPAHITRKLIRGFNQSQLIADHISKKTGKTLLHGIIKRKKRTKRLKNLSKREREEQLKDAFCFDGDIDLANCVILLVDDIFTTGSTLNSCSEILINNGACEVIIITFAVKCNYNYNNYK